MEHAPNFPPPLPPRTAGPPPLPVAGLDYRRPGARAGRGRPVGLIVIGIVSVAYGAISLLGAAGSVVTVLDVCRNSPWPGPAPVAAPRPQIEPYDNDPVGPDGLKAADRAAVLSTPATRSLSPDQRIMLDRFLADAGKAVFPGGVATLPPEQVADALADAGSSTEEQGDPWPVRLLRAPAGTLAVRATRVTFSSAGAPGEPIARRYVDHNIYTDAAGKQWWSSASLRDVLERRRQEFAQVRAKPNTSWVPWPNAVQATVLVEHARPAPPDALRPDAPAFDPAHPVYRPDAYYNWIWPPVEIEKAGPGDDLLVRLGNNFSPKGQSLLRADGRWLESGGDDPDYRPPLSQQRVVFWSARLEMADLLSGVVLMVMLTVAGVCMLAGRRGAAADHRRWAWFVLTSSLLFLYPSWIIAPSLWKATVDSLPAPLVAQISGVASGYLAFVTGMAVQLSYPIVLLIYFRRQSIHEYFAAQREPLSVVPPTIAKTVGTRLRRWRSRRAASMALAGFAVCGLLLALAHGAAALAWPASGNAWLGLSISGGVAVWAAAALLRGRARLRAPGGAAAALMALPLLLIISTAPALAGRQQGLQYNPEPVGLVTAYAQFNYQAIPTWQDDRKIILQTFPPDPWPSAPPTPALPPPASALEKLIAPWRWPATILLTLMWLSRVILVRLFS